MRPRTGSLVLAIAAMTLFGCGDQEEIGVRTTASPTTLSESTTTSPPTAVVEMGTSTPPPTLPAAPPSAPPCSTWATQEEAQAWMDANGAAYDTSNLDTNRDGRPCTAHFAPPATFENRPETESSQRELLDRIAYCESHGDPTAVSASGSFSGAWQFAHTPNYSTWLSYGGGEFAPHPTGATYEQQKVVAARVLEGSGLGAWPVCGRR